MTLLAAPVTLYYERLDSPLGPMVVGVTDHGLATILFGPDSGDHAPEVLRTDFASLVPAGGRTDTARRQIEEYFAGRLRRFDLPIDLRGTAFQVEVLTALLDVPYAQTRSYGQLAGMTGRRGGARAVGQVVRRNRIPIVVPCHRIVAAGGGLGGYGGRWEETCTYAVIKRFLL